MTLTSPSTAPERGARVRAGGPEQVARRPAGFERRARRWTRTVVFSLLLCVLGYVEGEWLAVVLGAVLLGATCRRTPAPRGELILAARSIAVSGPAWTRRHAMVVTVGVAGSGLLAGMVGVPRVLMLTAVALGASVALTGARPPTS